MTFFGAEDGNRIGVDVISAISSALVTVSLLIILVSFAASERNPRAEKH